MTLLRQIFRLYLLSAAMVPLACDAGAPETRDFVARFPPHANVVDVTKPPYSAKGDGLHDDTDALQTALNENVGRHKLLYFPCGTYVVSRTLTWPKNWQGHDNWGHTYLCGERRDRTIIRLKDGSFTSEKEPQAIMECGGFGSADWFHNYVENLTFDVGRGNVGATALRFYSNNSGAVRDCRFIAGEGSGAVGLDLAYRDMNGPLLVRNCEVTGFSIGIRTAGAVNGQTFEHITLRGQRKVGLQNEGQTVSMRDLVSDNEVPAVMTYGSFALVDARLTGRGAASGVPAMVNFNGGRIFLRGIHTSGYGRALGDIVSPDSAAAFRIQGADKPGSLGPEIEEYASQEVATLFPSPRISLRLPVRETPDAIRDDPAKWAVVDTFGADPSGKDDSAAAIQKAMDSGATTVFLPGTYRVKSTIVIRGAVRRIVGLGGMINYGTGAKPDFRLEDGQSPTVTFEHFAHVGGGIEIDTSRTVVMRSVSDCSLGFTSRAEGGGLFLEDFVTHDLRPGKHEVWARQLNIENEGTHLTNDGGKVWILGYKTERGGTLVHTLGGGRTEILGGFSYTTTAGKLAPMFVNDCSLLWAFFGEVCFSGDPFVVRVKEIRGTETRILGKDAHTAPFSGSPERR